MQFTNDFGKALDEGWENSYEQFGSQSTSMSICTMKNDALRGENLRTL